MKKVYYFFVLALLIFLLVPIISNAQELIYENPVVYVYELPGTESLRGDAEIAATSVLDFMVKKISAKGFSEIITAVSSKLVSTFASLFVGLINEAKTVGWPGEVEIFFLAGGNITNTVNTDEYFLPIIAVQTGDSLTPLHLKIETPSGSDSTNLIPEEEITNLSWSNINLVIPKRPYRFSTPGKYTFTCTVFSTKCSEVIAMKNSNSQEEIIQKEETLKKTYALRDTGPAGGYIFYDKGTYSDGWRYLEAAPASTEWNYIERSKCRQLIGGTETGIGTGKNNTDIICETDRVARLCDTLVYGGYDDWFLPSMEELRMMCENLYLKGVGGFDVDDADDCLNYCSSSVGDPIDIAWAFCFIDCVEFTVYNDMGNKYRVRAVRAF